MFQLLVTFKDVLNLPSRTTGLLWIYYFCEIYCNCFNKNVKIHHIYVLCNLSTTRDLAWWQNMWVHDMCLNCVCLVISVCSLVTFTPCRDCCLWVPQGCRKKIKEWKGVTSGGSGASRAMFLGQSSCFPRWSWFRSVAITFLEAGRVKHGSRILSEAGEALPVRHCQLSQQSGWKYTYYQFVLSHLSFWAVGENVFSR